MKHVHRYVAATLVCFGVLALAITLPDRGAGQDAGVACVKWRTEARYRGYGYSHIVIVRNECAARMACAVSTSTNPALQRVEVASGEQSEVTAFVGSPAREFTATVECKSAR